jgi:hypothetical protein
MHTSLTQDSRKALSTDWRGVRFPSCYTRAARSGSLLAGPGRGQGTLKKHAMLRTLRAADIAGIRALVVHAKDEEARRFYLKFDFVPSPSDPMHLLALLNKDVRRIVSGQ